MLVLGSEYGQAQALDANTPSLEDAAVKQLPIHVNGVFPNLTVMAEGIGSNSEAGIGALIPWANKLWAIGYVSHIKGKGLGLYEISEDMTMRRHPASVTGTFANRMAHWPSGQAFIGPHAIDADGNVRTIDTLKNYRLTATVTLDNLDIIYARLLGLDYLNIETKCQMRHCQLRHKKGNKCCDQTYPKST